MSTLYLTEQYAYVKKHDDCLLVQTQDKQTRQIPLLKVNHVIVVGEITLTTPALTALLEQGAEVCYLSARGEYRGRLSPPFSKNMFLRRAQYAACADTERTLAVSRWIVATKLENQRTMLLRGNRKVNDPELAATAERIQKMRKMVPQAQALDTLRGIEGNGATAYFTGFARLLRHDLGFARRVRRPPTDPVNALLGLAYTCLMNQVAAAIQTTGLDVYAGFLHSAQYARPSLALDLMEEFRPLVADSVALTLINNRILQADDFEEELGTVRLHTAGRRRFYEHFEQRLNTEIEHPVFGYKVTYRRCLELQARLLARWLEDDIPEYPPFAVR